jgi:hypothetical protein
MVNSSSLCLCVHTYIHTYIHTCMRYAALPRVHAQSNKNNGYNRNISHVPVIIAVKSTRSPNTSLSFHTATDTNTAPSCNSLPPSLPTTLTSNLNQPHPPSLPHPSPRCPGCYSRPPPRAHDQVSPASENKRRPVTSTPIERPAYELFPRKAHTTRNPQPHQLNPSTLRPDTAEM